MATIETSTINREAWLTRAIDVYFRPLFAQVGYKIPDVVHVSVGWGRGRAAREGQFIAGQCWSGSRSADGNPHVFICPVLADADEVAATLAHELIHATLDPYMRHGREFRKLAELIGLAGKMTATVAGPALAGDLLLATQPGGEIGPYPHSAISLAESSQQATSGPPPQVARWVKVSCPDHPEGGVVRTARATAERGAAPLCGEPVGEDGPPCGRRMSLPE